MNTQQKQLLLEDVKSDIARLEEELNGLRLVAAYLSRSSGVEAASADAPSTGKSSFVHQTTGRGHRFTEQTTQVEAAEVVLRDAGKGRPMSAMDIATTIAQRGYPREADRTFATSLFSTMSRRTDTFAKAGPGLWTLKAFVSNDEGGGKEEEAQEIALLNGATR